MDTVTLGRTGLDVSAAGLGCGGHSRLGQSRGATEDESIAVVRRALDLGITFIDTARAYGTEDIVGKGVAGHRDEVVISTKAHPAGRDGPLPGKELRESLEKSLGRLRTDCVDVFHLHGVSDDDAFMNRSNIRISATRSPDSMSSAPVSNHTYSVFGLCPAARIVPDTL